MQKQADSIVSRKLRNVETIVVDFRLIEIHPRLRPHFSWQSRVGCIHCEKIVTEIIDKSHVFFSYQSYNKRSNFKNHLRLKIFIRALQGTPLIM